MQGADWAPPPSGVSSAASHLDDCGEAGRLPALDAAHGLQGTGRKGRWGAVRAEGSRATAEARRCDQARRLGRPRPFQRPQLGRTRLPPSTNTRGTRLFLMTSRTLPWNPRLLPATISTCRAVGQQAASIERHAGGLPAPPCCSRCTPSCVRTTHQVTTHDLPLAPQEHGLDGVERLLGHRADLVCCSGTCAACCVLYVRPQCERR